MFARRYYGGDPIDSETARRGAISYDMLAVCCMSGRTIQERRLLDGSLLFYVTAPKRWEE